MITTYCCQKITKSKQVTSNLKKFNSIISIIESVILFGVLITPVMPKIKVSEGIYLLPLDIILMVLVPIYFCIRPTIFWGNKYSKYLISFWTILAFGSVLSQIAFINTIGILKVFKGILYVPIIQVMISQKKPVLRLRQVLFLGIIAQILNFYYFFYKLNGGEISIWEPEFLSSGFSNKFFEFSSQTIRNIPDQGSHGIWGTYCVLMLTLAIYLLSKRNIGTGIAFLAISISVLSISATVSRESILVLLVTLIMYYVNTPKRLILLISGILLLVFSVVYLSSGVDHNGSFTSIPILDKLIYTIESIQETGGESNITLRINTWMLIIYTYILDPLLIAFGTGYNLDYFGWVLSSSAKSGDFGNFVLLPEGLLFFAFSFGGFPALMAITLFLAQIATSFRNNNSLRIFYCFFIGLLLANLTSGASLISDLFYSQFLAILGSIGFFREIRFQESQSVIFAQVIK